MIAQTTKILLMLLFAGTLVSANGCISSRKNTKSKNIKYEETEVESMGPEDRDYENRNYSNHVKTESEKPWYSRLWSYFFTKKKKHAGDEKNKIIDDNVESFNAEEAKNENELGTMKHSNVVRNKKEKLKLAVKKEESVIEIENENYEKNISRNSSEESIDAKIFTDGLAMTMTAKSIVQERSATTRSNSENDSDEKNISRNSSEESIDTKIFTDGLAMTMTAKSIVQERSASTRSNSKNDSDKKNISRNSSEENIDVKNFTEDMAKSIVREQSASIRSNSANDRDEKNVSRNSSDESADVKNFTKNMTKRITDDLIAREQSASTRSNSENDQQNLTQNVLRRYPYVNDINADNEDGERMKRVCEKLKKPKLPWKTYAKVVGFGCVLLICCQGLYCLYAAPQHVSYSQSLSNQTSEANALAPWIEPLGNAAAATTCFLGSEKFLGKSSSSVYNRLFKTSEETQQQYGTFFRPAERLKIDPAAHDFNSDQEILDMAKQIANYEKKRSSFKGNYQLKN